MKLIITSILILVTCGTTSKTNELIGEWVVINNHGGFERGVGLVLDFKNDTEVTFASIESDKEVTLKYKIEQPDTKLQIEHEGEYKTFGYLKNVNKDRFTILTIDSSMHMEFRRIQETNLTMTKEELTKTLMGTSWISKRADDSVRIDFRHSHRWDNEQQPYEAMFHYWFTTPNKEKETWNIGRYENKLFIRYTNYQSVYTVHQIKEFTPDNIVWADTYENDNVVGLIRKKDLTDNEHKLFVTKLCQKAWTSIHVDTIRTGEGGQVRPDDEDILTFDKINESIEFKFNKDGTYNSTIAGQEWKNGLWSTTKDGQYIIIDSERVKFNWIQIQQSENNLVLSKLHRFKGGRWGSELFMLIMRFE